MSEAEHSRADSDPWQCTHPGQHFNASDVAGRIPKQALLETESPVNCVFDISWMDLVFWQSVSQVLHMRSIALVDGMLIQSGSSHNVLGHLIIRLGCLLDILQSSLPANDDLEHQRFDSAGYGNIQTATPVHLLEGEVAADALV